MMLRNASGSCLILGLVVAGVPAHGQDPLKFSDLEGLEVAARIVHDQTVRREGRQGTARLERDLKVVIGSGESLHVTLKTVVQSPLGRRQGAPLSGPFTLNEATERSSFGGGRGIWSYADGALTFVRTFKGGAFRSTIAFVRSGEGFSCTITEGFARERGTGPISLNSPIDGTPITILSTKQTSSQCTAKKG
jgi:hypothetical protein